MDTAAARLRELGATPVEEVTEVGGCIRIGTFRNAFGDIVGVIENPEFVLTPVDTADEGSGL